MEIDISGRHFQVTESLKEHIIQKVGKFEKYHLKIESVHVVLDVQKINHIAEIVVAGKNLRITAKEKSGDMYSAFDNCYTNTQLQLRRMHDKLKDHKTRTALAAKETMKGE